MTLRGADVCRLILAAVACVLPSLAQAEASRPVDCSDRPGCVRAFVLEGLHALDARPVPLPGNRIALWASAT